MKKLFIIVLSVLLFQCRERYDIPMSSPQTNYLVVEGSINPEGITTIQLSRTTPIAEGTPSPETGASVLIEGDDQSVYYLSEKSDGSYISDSINLNSSTKYRLHIDTKGKNYLSEYSATIQTPAVDSISWQRTDDGLDILVHAHDDKDNIQYYRWDFDETWEFHSAYTSQGKYVIYHTADGDSITIDHFDFNGVDYSIYTCWQSSKSNLINLASTSGLSSNVLQKIVKSYKDTAIQLSQLYSIDLRLHGMSKNAYNFYQKMKKNTESLGTIFDAQPSEISGNILCTTDPGEIVIGFVETSTSSRIRKFIRNQDIGIWRYHQRCSPPMGFRIFKDTPAYLYYNGYYPTLVFDAPGHADSVQVSDVGCVKCTLFGTNVKPDFWP